MALCPVYMHVPWLSTCICTGDNALAKAHGLSPERSGLGGSFCDFHLNQRLFSYFGYGKCSKFRTLVSCQNSADANLTASESSLIWISPVCCCEFQPRKPTIPLRTEREKKSSKFYQFMVKRYNFICINA